MNSLKSLHHGESQGIHHEIADQKREKNLWKKERISLPVMGRSTTGDGDSGTVVEVATSSPARCFGAIRTWRKFWKIRMEQKRRRENSLEKARKS